MFASRLGDAEGRPEGGVTVAAGEVIPLRSRCAVTVTELTGFWVNVTTPIAGMGQPVTTSAAGMLEMDAAGPPDTDQKQSSVMSCVLAGLEDVNVPTALHCTAWVPSGSVIAV